jgi:hypothetical protein
VTDRDWDKELAKIDAQIRSIPEEDVAPAKPTPSRAKAVSAGGTIPAGVPAGTPTEPVSRVGAFLRLGLAGALAVGMALWPFDKHCGVGLALYLFSVATLIFAGGWSALWTWRHRTAKAHILALVIVLWGIVLASVEVLPRIGYGPATLDRPRIWTCG